jgi:predicted HAD superfamily hydrolase
MNMFKASLSQTKWSNLIDHEHTHKDFLDVRLVSFDVFDTLITRMVSQPDGVFYAMSQTMRSHSETLIRCLSVDFPTIRKNAALEARRKISDEGHHIAHIYDVIADQWGVSEDLCQYLIDLELAFERQFIRPVPSMVRLLNDVLAINKRVILISDMYWPSDQIRMLLQCTKIPVNDIPIYVSCEVQRLKKTGRLFDHVLVEEAVDPQYCVHIGDHDVADVAVPQRLNWQSRLFTDTHLSIYEREWLGFAEVDETFLMQILTGAARYARLTQDPMACTDQFLMGVDLAGIILQGYVDWLMRSAQLRKISRLFFLARDGQILYRLANAWQRQHNSHIELRYVYVSRKALLLPALVVAPELGRHWLFLDKPYLTIRMIAQRLDLSEQDCCASINSYLGTTLTVDDHLDQSTTLKLRSWFNDQYRQLGLADSAQNALDCLTRYLQQEKFWDDDHTGVVDLGWQGSIQFVLSAVRNQHRSGKGLLGFYMWMNPSPFRQPLDEFKSYYSDADVNMMVKNPYRKTQIQRILEIFCSADHGLTLSYSWHQESNTVQPLLDTHSQRNMEDWGVEPFQKGVLALAQAVSECSQVFRMPEDDQVRKSMNLKMLMRIVQDPNVSEAHYFGSYPFSSDPAESQSHSIAPSLTCGDVFRYCLSKQAMHVSSWAEASVLNSRSPASTALAAYLVLRKWRDHFRSW